MARVCMVGGQAVMEGVMMKSPKGIALSVRNTDGEIVTEYKPYETRAKKGTFWGLPVVRGVVAFVESLMIGMQTITRSAELIGDEELQEEPTKFELWLSRVMGKSVEKIIMGVAVVLAVVLAVGLFFVLPLLGGSLIFKLFPGIPQGMKSLVEGVLRLLIFLGYIVAISNLKDIRRVFMYHGAEHKTIACYEAEAEITPENAMRYSRLHPRCGTNYLFLVMAVSIVFFALVGWSDNFLVRLGTRLLFLPVVAGLSYEVLRFAAKYDNPLTRIIRAPGMGLQKLTTREPTPDMIEVAIASFRRAMQDVAEKEEKTEEQAADAQ
ncbi:MAG: DUF1385 domain-containing protein [Clostridia bacterium]|nr:DUF1385 domain-containing protein [Clostridia bacterium]